MDLKRISNRDVVKILIGVPKGHKHLRIFLKLNDGSILLFNEAVVANIVRAYIILKTHPTRRAVKLVQKKLSIKNGLKNGYAEYQLLEENIDEDEIIDEITRILSNL